MPPLIVLSAIAALLSLASAECNRVPSEQPEYCTATTPAKDSADIPRSFGHLLYQGFEPLDFAGPFDALSYVGSSYMLDVHLIAETMDPVTSRPTMAAMIPQNSSTFFEISPTTTLTQAPALDVLIVPGGIGSRSPYLNSTIDFIRDRYPQLKYLISVCTGAILCSKAGILDGKNATTNKRAYKTVAAMNDKVHWQPEARWVVDGNIWSTSGVSSGIDGMMAFIKCIYGEQMATNVANSMEYERHVDARYDPFSAIWNVTSS